MKPVHASSVSIKVDRHDKTYRPNDMVTGVIIVNTHHHHMTFSSITMAVEGSINLHLNAKNVGLFEAFYGSIKPYVMIKKELNIKGPGIASMGQSEFPFEFKISSEGEELFETYHGVYINTAYIISVEIARGLLSTNLTADLEFVFEVPGKPTAKEEHSSEVCMTPKTLQNLDPAVAMSIPPFKIVGTLHRLVCPITEPLTGDLIIEQSDIAIKSIEMQLTRVETVSYAEGLAQEASEITSIQIASGDPCRGLQLPVYMIFPRLFTCPTMVTSQFRVEFEINIVVQFEDGNVVTEGFPLTLYRS